MFPSKDQIHSFLSQTNLASWSEQLSNQVDDIWTNSNDGNLSGWMHVLRSLPDVTASHYDLNQSVIQIGSTDDIDDNARRQLDKTLRGFHPWRKGPFNLFGIEIDTEWRSDMKWDRLKNHIYPLKDRMVLDIGAANGYHCLRMAGAGAKLAVGIDPTLLYAIQFEAFQKYLKLDHVAVFPLGIDDMPASLPYFDTVFSMGLLYHRRAPLDHLLQCKSFLRKGGELALDTLVIDGKEGEALAPNGRYAKMPNVWFIPTVKTLEYWCKRMGLTNIRVVDVTRTTSDEQHVTEWMGFQSLSDFLDPQDSSKTVEGYPAPMRAVVIANNPD